MRPLFWEGSQVGVRLCPGVDIKMGDIAVFKDGAGFVCHRVTHILKIDDRVFFRTKGDATLYADRLVDGSRVLGKVSTRDFRHVSVPVGGLFARFFGLGVGLAYPVLRKIARIIRKLFRR